MLDTSIFGSLVSLGRLPHRDPKNADFPLRAAPQMAVVVSRRYKRWAMFVRALNQGREGTCVGHAFKHWLLHAPTIQTKVLSWPTAIDIYREACKHDPWTENDFGDPTFGTSVLGAAKGLHKMGLVADYRWAETIDDFIDWLGGVDAEGRFVGGPVVVGFNWYTSMFATDEEGFVRINPRDRLEGGHSVCFDVIDPKRGVAELVNSWGDGFGPVNKRSGRRTGRGKMALETVERLLVREGGEACTTTEIRLAKLGLVLPQAA